MNEIIIRDIVEADLPALKSLIAEAFGKGWNLERYYKDEHLAGALLGIYLSIFLEPGTFGKVAAVDGEVVGVVLCSVNGQKPKFRQLLTDTAPNTLTLLAAAEDMRLDVVEHMSTSFQTIGGLLEDRMGAYDGGLELLAVTERARGLKIGKALWEEACAYYNSEGAKTIYLIADSDCNFGFYDNNGFTRAAARKAEYNYTTGQRITQVYVYEYRF